MKSIQGELITSPVPATCVDHPVSLVVRVFTDKAKDCHTSWMTWVASIRKLVLKLKATLSWRNAIGLSCEIEYRGDTIMLVTALELIDPRQGLNKSTQFFNAKLSNLGHVIGVAVACLAVSALA